jgi:hypothetical protein
MDAERGSARNSSPANGLFFDKTPWRGGPYRMSQAESSTQRLELLLLGGTLLVYMGSSPSWLIARI